MIHITDDIAIAESEITFRFFTSSGPGGQNVNRVATAAHLRFDAAGSPFLSDDVVRRLRTLAGRRMSSEGVIVIRAQRFRSQDRNRDDALERLVGLIKRASEPPRPRRSTRPSRASIERRLATKARRSTVKRSRGSARDED